MRTRTLLRLTLAAAFLLGGDAVAHEMRPALLELQEKDNHRWEMTWKVPARGTDMRLSLDVRLPDGFEWEELPSREFVGSAFVDRGVFHIPAGLNGREIYIEGLLSTFTDAMVQIHRLDGSIQTDRLDPSDPSLVVEARPSLAEVPRFYFEQGLGYLRGAWDHIAFVFVIVLVCSSNRAAVVSALAFLGGIVAVSVLGSMWGFSPNREWTEIVTALSLLPPALAIATPLRPAFVRRHPARFAAIAGLLHGASLYSVFASSAPTTRTGIALASFLAAVGLGLAVAAALAGTFRTIPRRVDRKPSVTPKLGLAVAYIVGFCSIAWTLQRW